MSDPAVDVIVCERCEEPFDPHREPVTKGADTFRCPGCGKSHDRPGADADAHAVEREVAEGSVTIALEVEVRVS
jgi:tRNA(Ile2) C34 agmatinyltransferase TiaS